MSEREIRNLLRQLNNEPGRCNIAITQLSTAVFSGVVYTSADVLLEQSDGAKAWPKSFYFVRSDDGRFVGAVHDAVGDLHWYLVRSYRGRGLMRNALRQTILPHIATLDRKEQLISISRGLGRKKLAASKRLADTLGFRLVTDPDGQVLIYKLDLTAQLPSATATANQEPVPRIN